MESRKDKLYSAILLIFAMVFYLFFAFYDGAVICVDTPTYVEMSITREFLYPALLAIFRVIFGEQYLLMIVVLQSILSAYAAWNITVYFKKQFCLNNILASVVFAMPLLVSLLNRFVAGRGSMYSNSILTEGIVIPLFLLFFRYVYEYIVNNSRRTLVISSIITGIMISTRKQMYVALILLVFAVFYVNVSADKREKGKCVMKASFRAVLLAVSLLVISTLLDHTYNFVLRGRFVGHSSDNRFVLTMVFYTAEEEYVEELPEELQPLYMDIYKECDEQGYLMHSAGDGWYNNVVHFGDCYDLIQINTMWPAIQDYVEENYTNDATDRQLLTDDITGVMISSLIDKTAPNIVKVLFNNFLSGLVTTVAQRNHILIWYSLIVYIGYVGISLLYGRKVRKFDSILKLCMLTLVSIIINVGLVSAVIFCQTRYTVYNMPLFYISGIVLLKQLYSEMRTRKVM